MSPKINPDKINITMFFRSSPDKYPPEYRDTFQARYDVMEDKIKKAILDSGLEVMEIQVFTF